jgi:flavin reductase
MNGSTPNSAAASRSGVTLRHALGHFATGVTVITTRDPDTGNPHGMTANAFMSGSLEPPLVLVSVREAAHLHSLIVRNGNYGVSFLSEGLEREARRFAGMPVEDHEAQPVFHDRGDVPILGNCLAWMATKVVDTHVVGDHTLFVGQVTEFGVDRADDPPLLFHRSAFGRVAPSEFAPLESDAWGGSIDLWG